MDDREFQSLIEAIAVDAANFVDDTLSPMRAEATKFYLGGKLGNEEEGRSQFVMTTVRDSVLGVLPSALRVIFGAEHPVEFVPTRADTVEVAAQATDYVRHVFSQENNGFALTHSVWKDALVRKTGVYKWGWDDTSRTTTYQLKGIPQSQLEQLVADEGVELLRATPSHPGVPAVTSGEGQQVMPAQEPQFDVELKHSEVDGCPRIWTLPPEEFLFSADGRDIETATLVGHRTRKTTSELLAMGVSQDDIDEHGGTASHLDDNAEQLARVDVQGGENESSDEAGDANRLHDYAELFPFVDFDGDGIAELRRVCTIGPVYHVISNEPARERPFSLFCPDPEPHTMLGQSWADRLMDLQRMNSSIVRGVADSLSLSLFPRIGYVEGQVNYEDIQNTEIGAAIRMKTIGQIQPILHPFVGKEAFPLLEFLEQAKEQRTGQDNGALGLDADALQSTEKAAAGAAITAAQGQTELLVRIFAETTLKPLFRGILGLLCEYQPKQKMVKLRGQWVAINPRAWDANMDVTVNVALGTTLVEQKMASMMGLAAKQELVIQTFGPQNPLCSLAQYGNTLRKLAELSGHKDVDNYFSQVPADWAPPAPQGPPPDPMVAVKQQELQLRAQTEQQSAAIEQMKLQAAAQQHAVDIEQREADRAQALSLAQEEIRMKVELGAAELELKYKTQIAIEEMRVRVEGAAEVAKNERELANNALQHERTMIDADRTHELAVAKLHQDHEHSMAKIEVEKTKAKAKPKPAAKKKA